MDNLLLMTGFSPCIVYTGIARYVSHNTISINKSKNALRLFFVYIQGG